MIKAHITDGKGDSYSAQVSKNRTLQVGIQVPEVPDVGMPSRIRYFNALLGSTGADSGSTDQVVDGSGTPQEFFIGANNNFDIRITHIIVTISDTTINLSKFGGLAALATGWDLIIDETGIEIPIINKAKTNGEIAIQATVPPEIYQNFSGASDGFVAILPVGEDVLNGIRIGRGTKDKLKSVVNDALAGLVNFNVRAIGYRHYP